MEQNKQEFLQLLCGIYLVALLVVLPLYTGEGYWRLGDSKYLLFRNVSLFCLGAWAVVLCLSAMIDFVKYYMVQRATGYWNVKKIQKAWSVMDSCMLLYGVSVLISAVSSAFLDTAWTGYQDWYMGAVSQLLFVGGYFFVSRCFVHRAFLVYLAEAAFLAVVGIGLLNRMGYDPLGLYVGVSKADWTYSHMISTIGNINWFCGYCSVVLAFPVAGYLYSKRRWKTILLYMVSVSGLVLLAIQGSDSGVVLVTAAIGICLLAGLKKAVFFQKGLLLFIGTALGIRIMGQIIELLEAWEATPVDGGLYKNMLWNGWCVAALLAGVVWLVHNRLHKRAGEKAGHKFVKVFLLLGIITLLIAGSAIILKWCKENIVYGSGNLISGNSDFESWGSGRGALWSLAWYGFSKADSLEKIIGVGPDCFAPYLLSIGKVPVITEEGRWGEAIFANAHNEWLNHLVNLGIMGMGCYFSIFVTGLKRYRGMLLAMLAIGMYGVHSLVSFQQVLNTPFLFIVLGLCEATYKKVKLASEEAKNQRMAPEGRSNRLKPESEKMVREEDESVE